MLIPRSAPAYFATAQGLDQFDTQDMLTGLDAELAKARAQLRQHVAEHQEELLSRAAVATDVSAVTEDLMADVRSVQADLKPDAQEFLDSMAGLRQSTQDLRVARDVAACLRAVTTLWHAVSRAAAALQVQIHGQGAAQVPAKELATAVGSATPRQLAALGPALAALRTAAADPLLQGLHGTEEHTHASEALLLAARSRVSELLLEAARGGAGGDVASLLATAAAVGHGAQAVDSVLTRLTAEAVDAMRTAVDVQRVAVEASTRSVASPVPGRPTSLSAKAAQPAAGQEEAWRSAFWVSGIDAALKRFRECAGAAWLVCTATAVPATSTSPALHQTIVKSALCGDSGLHCLQGLVTGQPESAASFEAWSRPACALVASGLFGAWLAKTCAGLNKPLQAVLQAKGFLAQELAREYPAFRARLSNCVQSLQTSTQARLAGFPPPPAVDGVRAARTALLRTAAAAATGEHAFMQALSRLTDLLAEASSAIAASSCACADLASCRSVLGLAAEAAERHLGRARRRLLGHVSEVYPAMAPPSPALEGHAALERALQECAVPPQGEPGRFPSLSATAAFVKALNSTLMAAHVDGLLMGLASSVVVSIVCSWCCELVRAAGALPELPAGSLQPSGAHRTRAALLTRVQQLGTGIHQGTASIAKRAIAFSGGAGTGAALTLKVGAQLQAWEPQGAECPAAELVPVPAVLQSALWPQCSSVLAAASRALLQPYALQLQHCLASTASGMLAAAYQEAPESVEEASPRWLKDWEGGVSAVAALHVEALPSEGGVRRHVAGLLCAEGMNCLVLLASMVSPMDDAGRVALSRDLAHAEAALKSHIVGEAVGLDASTRALAGMRTVLFLSTAQLLAALRGEGEPAAQQAVRSVPPTAILLHVAGRCSTDELLALPHEAEGQPPVLFVENALQQAPGDAAQGTLRALLAQLRDGASSEQAVWLRAEAPAFVVQG